MQQLQLGRTDITVSEWCLGTMTYGNQTPLDDALRQMDMALEAGITFWDCAEMYPVNPVTTETAGRSETFLGEWLSRRGLRGRVQIATKVAGPDNVIRGQRPLDASVVAEAVTGSLRRLKTDEIDLYQIHWPARGTWAFRRNWGYDPSGQDAASTFAHMDDMLGALSREVEKGRIRAFGLSNETAWGTTRWIDRAALGGGPRVASVQNEYSLLARLYDTDMAEVSVNEEVTLLAFSPLAAGFLTGKYQEGIPVPSRMAVSPEVGGRNSPRVRGAVAAYLEIAARYDLDPVHMALAWHRTRPFASVPIFGATSAGQLARIIGGIGVTLSPEVTADIAAAHRAHPLPY